MFFIAAIVFLSMSIVLIYSPAQLFSRHDPVMIRVFNSKQAYKRILQLVGGVLMIAGLVCAVLGFIN